MARQANSPLACLVGCDLESWRTQMHQQTGEPPKAQYSPTHIRATWDGTGSVADASKALGFSRAKGYALVRCGEFPCRVLRVGRSTRVVTASLLRVLDSGEPEYNGAPKHSSMPASTHH